MVIVIPTLRTLHFSLQVCFSVCVCVCVVLLRNNWKTGTKSWIWWHLTPNNSRCLLFPVYRKNSVWCCVCSSHSPLSLFLFLSFNFNLSTRLLVCSPWPAVVLSLPLALPPAPSRCCVSWQGTEMMVVRSVDSGASQVSSNTWHNKYQGGITTRPWPGI